MSVMLEHDFEDKETMLTRLDEFRKEVEAGEVTGYAITALEKGGLVSMYKAAWWGQKHSLIGALEIHKTSIMSELLSDKIASEMGL